MNVGITGLNLNSADFSKLADAMLRQASVAERQQLAISPFKEGKLSPEYVAAQEAAKYEKRLQVYEDRIAKEKQRRDDMSTLSKLQSSLAREISSLSRQYLAKSVSATGGVTGSGSVRAVAGNYDVKVIQKPEKCRFTFDGLTLGHASSPWTADTDVACSNIAAGSSFFLNGEVGPHLRLTQGTNPPVDITLVDGHTLAQTVQAIDTALDASVDINARASIEVYDGNNRRIVIESESEGQPFTVEDITPHATMFDTLNPIQRNCATVVEMRQLDGADWNSADIVNTHAQFPDTDSIMTINGVAITYNNFYDPVFDTANFYFDNLVNDINRFTEQTGVIARRVKLGGDTTTYVEFQNIKGGNIEIDANPLEVSSFIAPGCFKHTTVESKGKIEFNNSPYTRDTADFSDVIPGVTLDISSAALGDSVVTVKPGRDYSGLVRKVVDTYNEVNSFIVNVRDTKNADGLREHKIWSSREFGVVRHELSKIASHRMFIGSQTYRWSDFGVEFGDTATIDTAKFEAALASPEKAVALEEFLSGTGTIAAAIYDNSGGNAAIIRTASTYNGGGSLRTHSGAPRDNIIDGDDLRSVEVIFAGGDNTDISNYTVTVNGDAPITYNIAINLTDPNDPYLEIDGTLAYTNLHLDYHIPAGTSGYTDETFFTYVNAGATEVSNANITLTSSGKNIDELGKVTGVVVRANNIGVMESYILYNGTVVNLNGADGTVVANGSGYELEVTLPGHALEGLKLQYAATGDPLLNSQSHVFGRVALGAGLGTESTRLSNTKESFIRSDKNAQKIYENALEKYLIKKMEFDDAMQAKMLQAQMDTMLNELDSMQQVLAGLFE